MHNRVLALPFLSSGVWAVRALTTGLFFIIIYIQHAPLHCYAILHACFIVYSSIVSVILITRDYNGPFHNLSVY